MRIDRENVAVALVTAMLLLVPPALGQDEAPVERDVGDRRELFVDDWLIASRRGVDFRLHSPTPREVALTFNEVWEGVTTGFVTVLKDEDRYRCYYSNDTGHCFTSYAESPDGIHWTKPELRLIEYLGSRENNIILEGPALPNFSPFRDSNPAALPEQRYKAVVGMPMFAYVSPDGIRWSKLQDKPVMDQGPFDSQNLAFWDVRRGRYVAFVRSFRERVRWIRTATSDDFVNWSATQDLDFGSAPAEHLYTNAITPYVRAPHLYVGLPMRFLPERKLIAAHPHPGVSDGVFISSRDGLHFDRRFLEPFIPPNLDIENWTDRAIIPAWGIVPTGPTETSVYWVEHYRHPTIRLRRGTLRPDGFASLHASSAGGEFTTHPLRFKGSTLSLNFATSAVGYVRVAVLDASGAELPGFALSDCPEIYGNSLEQTVNWKPARDLSQLPQPVRLRFEMKDADLFAMRFGP